MKDVVVSGRRIARELLIFAGCFVVALGVNAYAIVRFRTEWKELITTLPITVAVAVIIFAFVALLRGLILGCRRLFMRKAA